MEKEFLEKQKQKLEKEKKRLESQLSSFAKKRLNSQRQGNWKARHPQFNGGHLEEEADEVEEYGTRLALGETLEKELKDISLALEKIKKGKYGICEKCGNPIPQDRLKVHPQARFCKKCQK